MSWLILWQVNIEEPIDNLIKTRAFKILRGHRGSVQSVAAQSSGEMVYLFSCLYWFLCWQVEVQSQAHHLCFCFGWHILRFVQVLGIAQSIYGAPTMAMMVILRQSKREKWMIKLKSLNWRYTVWCSLDGVSYFSYDCNHFIPHELDQVLMFWVFFKPVREVWYCGASWIFQVVELVSGIFDVILFTKSILAPRERR